MTLYKIFFWRNIIGIVALVCFLIIGIRFALFKKIITINKKETKKQTHIVKKINYENLNKLREKTAFKNKVYIQNNKFPVPTNQWFSSVLFEKASEPMFAYPLAIKMDSDGFGISYPSVVSTANTVFASYSSDIKIVFQKNNALDSYLDSSDDLSAEILQKNGKNIISKIRITHGSPFVYISVPSGESFNIHSNNLNIKKNGKESFIFSANGKTFAFFFSSNNIAVAQSDKHTLNVLVIGKTALCSIAVLPNTERINSFRQYALDPIINTKVDFKVENNKINTRYEISTQSGEETLLALLPKSYQHFDSDSNDLKILGYYKTLFGKQRLYKGKAFSFSREIVLLPQQLDLSILSNVDKAKLKSFVSADAAQLSVTKREDYFIGKKIYAMANVLDIAEQLKMDNESEILRAKLKTELNRWRKNTLSNSYSRKYLYYDPLIKGIVAEPDSFGSELFNDHNFHYGYFIYAASILSRYDKKYLSNNEAFINLFVKDIANINRKDKAFPYIRGFDAYEEHSWASGMGIFTDGNNQESSSEAVNAWYSIYLWSNIIRNKELRDASLYLYSEESSSALDYYLNFNKQGFQFKNFQHSLVGIIWGGKLDFATWFSSRPEAILAIQLLPFNPGSRYLGINKNRVRENLESDSELKNPTLFKDYLAMYQAFYDVSGAQKIINQLTLRDIDSANSKSYMEAWLFTLKKLSR